MDTNENGLTELTRDLRSSGLLNYKPEYITYPVNLLSETFDKIFWSEDFDLIANFSAHIINKTEVFSELFKHHSLVINFDKKNELKQSLDELKKNYKEFQSNEVKFANSFTWEETLTKIYNLY